MRKNKQFHRDVPTSLIEPQKRNVCLALLIGVFLALAFPATADSVTITDPSDMADSSGDIRSIQAYVLGEDLVLSMSVQGIAGPLTEQTPAGMNNRYYYHWLLDTDNNPATGRSNAEYEGNPTGVTTPIGADLFVQVGWNNGLPSGIDVYDPADEDNPLFSDFLYQAAGNSLRAVIPLADLGLVAGQTIAVSAFQEGASDGWAVDWLESDTLTLNGPAAAAARVIDPTDMADSSGDIRSIQAYVLGEDLVLSMSVQGIAGPLAEQTPAGMNNRYYYHWLLDTDNNPATGRSNAEYEGNPTGVTTPIGADLFVQVGWNNGLPSGIDVYDPADEDNPLFSDFSYRACGNSLYAVIPLADLGLVAGQTIAVSAFQEGASDGWAVDWIESDTVTLNGPTAPTARVTDPTDMADSSGDIRSIQALVIEENLVLSMSVQGIAGPLAEQTPAGMNNRYYYHWLLDTDNNPATGRSNAEYEGNPTGVTTPIGADLFVQVGWNNGLPSGIDVYDPADEDNPLFSDFTYQTAGNLLTASIPLADLGLVVGQTIAVSAFQEGASDGWAVDWIESDTVTLQPASSGRMAIDGLFDDWADAGAAGDVMGQTDPADMADSSGDIREIQATVENDYLYLRMRVEGVALPSADDTPVGMQNRYYYHWLLDTDNNPATGRSNAEYEGSPTGVTTPIGADLFVQIGWASGVPNGVEVYDPAAEDIAIVSDFEFQEGGDSVEARIALSDLGLVLGQTIALSAFQEGASDGWAVDWMESVVVTLTEGGAAEMDLDSTFVGNAFDFTITVTDTAELIVDPDSVAVEVGGETAAITVTQANGVTTIVGRNPTLLPANSSHTVTLSLQASGTAQAQDYTLVVKSYTVLPPEGRVAILDTTDRGFVAHITAISSWQLGDGVYSAHNNVAADAETQLAGGLTDGQGYTYLNEAYPEASEWMVNDEILTDPINWYEFAPAQTHPIQFPNDLPVPLLSVQGFLLEGVVVEFLGYLELEAGYHTFGLFTEGGYKANVGLSATAPVAGLFDDAAGSGSIPTYYARAQSFSVVAQEPGYYPLRLLWFQSDPGQEQGMMLEFYSIVGTTPHLVNDASDPDSVMVYRTGALLAPGDTAAIDGFEVVGGSVTLQWRGQLQMAEDLNGPWTGVAYDTESPMTMDANGAPKMYFRAKEY